MISAQMGKPVAIKYKKVSRPIKYHARDCFKISDEIFAVNRIDGERARTLREWAQYELRMGNKEGGVVRWREAKKMFEELGAGLEVERMAKMPP